MVEIMGNIVLINMVEIMGNIGNFNKEFCRLYTSAVFLFIDCKGMSFI
jgi:hypothetical protein